MKVKKLLKVMSLEPPIGIGVNGYLPVYVDNLDARLRYGDYKVKKVYPEELVVRHGKTERTKAPILIVEKPKKPLRWKHKKFNIFDLYQCPYCNFYNGGAYNRCSHCNKKVRKPK